MATIANNTMYGVSIQLKYKNADQWQSSDVLLAGEIGLEFDTKKYKLGDGVTAWGALDYYSNPQVTALVTSLTERVTAVEAKDTTQDSRLDAVEAKDTAQDTRLDTIEAKDTAQDGRLDAIEAKDTAQDADITALKGITVISANPAPASNG